MKKLQLLPDSSSYNVKFGEGNISTRLSGGASRVRKDTVDNVHSINVGFNLNKEQYQYIMAFYRHITKRGALPFLMDLITDEGSPQTHKVQIVPNTFQLSEQAGHRYGISFTVEAEPLSEHAESDTQLIANYESGKPLHTDPQQGWGNFFKPTELDENASNVQDGIYRINGNVVVSLRDAKGRIYQTRYTKQGIDVRFFDTKWSTWLNIGGKRLFRTFTTAYKHNTGEVVKQFDDAGISGNLPNGEYDIVVTEEYADGSQQEVARTRQVINITSGTLTTIPSNYAIFLQWSVPAKSGGYTEIWVSNNTELSNAKLINVVDWPLDSYMYTGASQHENYYFWVRPIDKRGIEGAFTGPVKGEVATPFEEDFRNLQNQLQESLNQADAKADKKLQQLEAEVKDIVRKTTNTLNSDILTRLDGFDNKFRTEAQQRTEALQREADARTRAIQAEQSARVQAIKQSSDKAAADLLAKSNQLGTRITTVETVNNNQTQQINTLTTNLGNANAAIERESKTRADAISAEARARETLVAKLNDNTAAINEEKRVRAEKDRSQAEQTTQLSSRVAGAEADITSLRRTYSDFQSSQATQLTELKAKVNNVKIGGRNLIRKSNPNATDSNYLHMFKITEAPKFGDDVVVTLWGELGQGRTDFAVYNSEGWGELAKLKKVSDGVYQAQFKWADNTYTGRDKTTNVNLNVYAYPNSATSNNTIKKVKFERGTIGTDWTPAPEDVGIEVDKTKATINEFKQTQATKDEASARKQTELTSKVNGLTTKVETNASTINGVSAEKTVFIDNNGYLTGYKLLSDRNSGQPRGEIYFSVDKFKVGKPGYNNITPFTIDTANRIIAIDGSLVVNGEALIRKLNAGVIDAAKIKAGSIDSSRIAANAITADKIGAGQITAQKIASKAISADHIASNSISTDKLMSGSITAAKIATGSITADKMHIENLSALSSDLGNVRAGDINIGGGAFTVDRSGNLYARNGRFEGTVYADKIEGDVLKFYPFSKANTGRYRLVYTNTNQKDVLLSLQNLSFLTPNSKSSYWVKIKINGQQVYLQEFWSIFSHTSGGRYVSDIYRGIFYNVPFIYIVNGNTTSEIIIEVDHQTDYNTSAVDIISTPYILAARI